MFLFFVLALLASYALLFLSGYLDFSIKIYDSVYDVEGQLFVLAVVIVFISVFLLSILFNNSRVILLKRKNRKLIKFKKNIFHSFFLVMKAYCISDTKKVKKNISAFNKNFNSSENHGLSFILKALPALSSGDTNSTLAEESAQYLLQNKKYADDADLALMVISNFKKGGSTYVCNSLDCYIKDNKPSCFFVENVLKYAVQRNEWNYCRTWLDVFFRKDLIEKDFYQKFSDIASIVSVSQSISYNGPYSHFFEKVDPIIDKYKNNRVKTYHMRLVLFLGYLLKTSFLINFSHNSSTDCSSEIAKILLDAMRDADHPIFFHTFEIFKVNNAPDKLLEKSIYVREKSILRLKQFLQDQNNGFDITLLEEDVRIITQSPLTSRSMYILANVLKTVGSFDNVIELSGKLYHFQYLNFPSNSGIIYEDEWDLIKISDVFTSYFMSNFFIFNVISYLKNDTIEHPYKSIGFTI